MSFIRLLIRKKNVYRNIWNIVNVIVGVHEDGGNSKANEDESSDEGDDSGRDEPGHDHADEDGPARAHGVTRTASDDDAPDVVEAGQDYGGQLGPVTPLRYEGHAETLDEHLEYLETGTPTARVALAVSVKESVQARSFLFP